MTKQEVLNIDTNTAQMSINQLKESIKKLKEELGQLKIGTQQYEQKSKELITAQNNLKKANDLTKASMDNFSNSIAGMQVKLTNVRRELYQMSTADPKFKQKAKEVEQLAAALNKAKIAAGDYKNNIGNYASGFSAFGNIMKGVGGQLVGFTSLAGGAAAAVALLAKGFSNLIDVNKSFEQENANLAAILRTSKSEISDLTESARRLGSVTLYTAQEVTQLQIALAKLGFDSEEIQNMQSSVLNFAVAVTTDLSSAAELSGAVLRMFGKDSTETSKLLNQLALSTTNSALSFEKLATAMPIVGPVAHQLGFELSDTVAILAKLVDTGMDASTAATSTRNIMLFLADSNSKLSKALGHAVTNVDELSAGLKELYDKGMSLGEIYDLADKRSVAALSTLIEQNEELSRFKKELEAAGDAIDTMANEKMNTLQGSITTLKSAWQDLLLSFSGTNGVLKGAIDSITEYVREIQSLIDGFNKSSERRAADYVEDEATKRAEEWTENYNKLIEEAGGNVADAFGEDADAIQRLQAAAEKVKTDAQEKLEYYKKGLDNVNEQIKQIEPTINRGDKLQHSAKWFGAFGQQASWAYEKIIAGDREHALQLEAQRKAYGILIAEQERYIRGYDTINNDIDLNKKVNNNKGAGGLDSSAIANLRAMYEARMQYDITQKKKENQNEIDFENSKYEINKKYFDKILNLYARNSTEYYHMIVKIEQEEQAHIDRLNKIKDAKIQADAEAEILEYTKLNAAMVISDQELADQTLKIKKNSLAERKKLYSENSKEYQNLLREEARLERQRAKEHEDYVRQMVKQGENAYEDLKRQLRRMAQGNMSEWAKANDDYYTKSGKLTEDYAKSQGALDLKRLEAIKAINNSEILSEEEKAAQKLLIEEEYLRQSEELYKTYQEAQEAQDRKHEKNLRRAREHEIVEGAKAAIEVMELFNESLQDGTLSAIGEGLTNMANDLVDTFAKIGPMLDALDESFDDIGISMSDQEKSLVKIGMLAGTTFNAMGNMLSGIANAQDQTSREGFEAAKKMNIAAATMSMIGGVVNSLAGIPQYIGMFKFMGPAAPAAGIALGSALATTVGVMGAINIAKIASQKFDGGSSGAATNTGALNSIVAPVQYSAQVEGASTTDNVDQEQYVVHVSEINAVQSKVRVAENESKF